MYRRDLLLNSKKNLCHSIAVGAEIHLYLDLVLVAHALN